MKNVVYQYITGLFIFALLSLHWGCTNDNATTDTAANDIQQTVAEQPVQNPEPVATATAPNSPEPATQEVKTDKIDWMTWDEAVAAHQQDPKMVFIDIYTDWCGWCKVMDQRTFTDPKIIEYINRHYYPVKFNAEKEPTINFQGREFKVVDAGRRGIHLLAYALLEGQMSYPAYVFLNENFERVHTARGFQPAEQFINELDKATAYRTQ